MTTEAERSLTGAYLQGLPVHAARALEAMEPADVAVCLDAFEPASVAPAVAAMRAGAALAALSVMPVDKACSVLGSMDRAAAAGILRLADEDRRSQLTQGMHAKQARLLRQVAGYPVDVAGAWCDPLAPVWLARTKCGEVQEAIREMNDGPPDPLMLVDEDGQFAGCVRITDLMSASVQSHAAKLSGRGLTPLLDTMKLADVNTHEGWLDYSLLPVIDVRGRLVGTLSRRRLAEALGKIDRADDPGPGIESDIISGATAGTAGWLALILEAFLARNDPASRPHTTNANPKKRTPTRKKKTTSRAASKPSEPEPRR